MNSFTKRTITGSIFVFAILAALLFGKYTFAALFLIIVLIGLKEFYQIFEHDVIKPQKYIGLVSGILVFTSFYGFYQFGLGPKIFVINLLSAIIIFITEIFRKTETPFENIAITLLGLIYIAFPLALLNYFVTYPQSGNLFSPKIALGIFILLWTNDTGAYLIGITLGKHKIFKRVSPKKSWEGFIGGILFSILISVLLYHYIAIITLNQWVVTALITSITGVLGDFTESILKRSKNIKDSGNFLPGHGGILDRFDSLLIAVPVVFCYFQFI